MIMSCWINYIYFAALTTSAAWLAVLSAELLDAVKRDNLGAYWVKSRKKGFSALLQITILALPYSRSK